LPFEQRVGILNLQERVKLTPRTPVTIPEIEERLEKVRRIGYALSHQDTVSGLRALAVPILDADGHPYAGVSVAAPPVACSLEDFVANSAGPEQQAAKDLGRILSLAGLSAVNHF
jgi:IclR family pca regulon transcriptional regulator